MSTGRADTGKTASKAELVNLYEWLRDTARTAYSLPAKEVAGFVRGAADERLGPTAGRGIRPELPDVEGLDDTNTWAVGYLGDVLRHAVGDAEPFDPDTSFVGHAKEIVKIRNTIEDLATSRHPVLLIGERGTGKGQLMRAIHLRSNRGRTRPMHLVSLAATPADLAESELFGHMKGSFTGAVANRVGVFRSAMEYGQAVFLDDIGECPEVVQVKLLSTLDDGFIRPVGSDFPVSIGRGANRRLKVVASIQPAFLCGLRPDLRDRLWFHPQLLPPLRERGLDMLFLADLALDMACRGTRRRPRMSREVRREILTQHWPGNVRELFSLVARSARECRGRTLDADAVSTVLEFDAPHGNVDREGGGGVQPFEGPRGFLTLREATERHVREALRRTGGNTSRAARLLGMPRTTLQSRLKRMR